MTKKLLFVVAILCALTLAVFAADVSGKWTWEQQGRNGATTSTLTLKADGSKLTGSLDGGRGATDISDGKVDGNSITFNVKRLCILPSFFLQWLLELLLLTKT
jgi:hypothetical protein